MVNPHLLHATKKLHATNLNYFISAVKRNIFLQIVHRLCACLHFSDSIHWGNVDFSSWLWDNAPTSGIIRTYRLI